MAAKSSSKPGAKARISQFTSAEEDARTAGTLPDTPQTMAPAYRLAFEDAEFLKSDPMRGVRLQLELEKPERIMHARGLESTVILFGGARIPAPGAKAKGATATARKSLEALSDYYREAEEFARLVSIYSRETYGREFVIATGGGPGIMEAGNKGAMEAGGASVGLNMVLPNEEQPNEYISPEFCFNFHYFSIRKMHFLMRARAAAVFPGGFGTLDELFEVLTLIQMQRMQRIPILLFGEKFWKSVINFEALRDAGTISPKDLDLFQFVETADEAWRHICAFYKIDPPSA
ncbi:MAG: LOG family protein [Neomegalonema sp.]|nr:LOG family protein [Neomegalonema sp.]